MKGNQMMFRMTKRVNVMMLFTLFCVLAPVWASAFTCTLPDYNKTTIAGGGFHTVGLKEDGSVVAVGYSGDGRLNVGDWANMTAVAASYGHTVGLQTNGTVVAVGLNTWGQLNVTDPCRQ